MNSGMLPGRRKACFEIRKVPYYDRVGKRHGLMGFGRDITERKRYQDALERASRDKPPSSPPSAMNCVRRLTELSA